MTGTSALDITVARTPQIPVPGLVVRLTVIKAKTRPGIEARLVPGPVVRLTVIKAKNSA